MKHYNVVVSGLVQNVFFRDSTKALADTLGIYGFVQNKEDGTVYVEIEGEEAKLQSMIQWLHKGPDAAQVETVSISEGPLGDYVCFDIK